MSYVCSLSGFQVENYISYGFSALNSPLFIMNRLYQSVCIRELDECVRVIYYFHFDYKKRNNGSVQQQVFLVYLLPVLLVYYYENQKMDSREYVHKFFLNILISFVGWISCKYVIIIRGYYCEMKMLHYMSHNS